MASINARERSTSPSHSLVSVQWTGRWQLHVDWCPWGLTSAQGASERNVWSYVPSPASAGAMFTRQKPGTCSSWGLASPRARRRGP